MKRNLSLLLLLLFVNVGFSQVPDFEPKWSVSNQNLAVLKKEKFIKLEVVLDSFYIEHMTNTFYLPWPVNGLYDSLKTIFTNRINKEFGSKTSFISDLPDGTYNYVLRVTPLSYYTIEYIETFSTPSMYQHRECHVKEMFGDYRFEIFDATHTKLLSRVNLTNMKNSFYVFSTCNSFHPRRRLDRDIYANMAKVGKIFGNYFFKLIKNAMK